MQIQYFLHPKIFILVFLILESLVKLRKAFKILTLIKIINISKKF